MTIQTDTTEIALPLELSISQYGVGGVTGQAPTVAIRLAAAGTPSYLDWGSSTFKTSGWATKYQVMSEIERGHYQQMLNVSTLALTANTKLIAEFAVTGAFPILGVAQEEIYVNNVTSQVTLLRKVAKNRLEETSGNPGHLVLYDDDNVTAIETWSITDETGGAVLPAVGTPSKRSAGTP
jgi:hypothetical protein